MLDKEIRNQLLPIIKKAKRPSCSQIEQKQTKSQQYNEETAIQQIRAQPEEEYKKLMSPIISYFLTKLVQLNDQLPAPQQNSNLCPTFNAQSIPEISIQNYLARIVKYSPCTPESFYIAIVFLDRIIETKGMLLTSLSVHRFLITSILVAAKIYDDTTFNNKYYSHVAGISLQELNSLELTFLALIDFNLSVDPVLFDQYRYQVELQIIRSLETVNATDELPFGPENIQEQEEISSEIVQARENARNIPKRIRRSRSFTQVVSDTGLFKWRKRRSASFNVLVVAS